MATSKKIKLLNQDNGYPLNILDLDEAKLKELGRNYIGIEQNAKYALEAEKRINSVCAISAP